MSELQSINERLKELNTEFSELNALKKEIQTQDRKDRLADSFSKYKFIIKEGTVEEFDYLTFLDNKHAQVGHSPAGLAIVSDGANLYSVCEEEDEAEMRVKVDKLLTLADELAKQYQPEDKKQRSKQYSVVEIYDEFVART